VQLFGAGRYDWVCGLGWRSENHVEASPDYGRKVAHRQVPNTSADMRFENGHWLIGPSKSQSVPARLFCAVASAWVDNGLNSTTRRENARKSVLAAR
jgi:hypothetical protein